MTNNYLQDSLFEVPKLQMPKDIAGEYKKNGGYTKTTPRDWTEGEIEWVTLHHREGYSVEALAEATGRSIISVATKLKRLSKEKDTYNILNRRLKYQTNDLFMQFAKPKTVLDVYAGDSWWAKQDVKVTTNDVDEKFDCNYQMDALKLLCKLYIENKKFDVIDLDPYGSAFDLIPLALKMSKKGIVISFGEWGHKRWKRIDFVRDRYSITNLLEFTDDSKFVAKVQELARIEKKQANVFASIQYANFLRIYFQLEDVKITEQWQEQA